VEDHLKKGVCLKKRDAKILGLRYVVKMGFGLPFSSVLKDVRMPLV
jgi:hypothetical protein